MNFTVAALHAPAVAKLLRRNDNFVVTGAAVFRRDAVISAGGFQSELSTFADGYLVRKIALMRGFCYAPVAVMTWCVFAGGASRTTSTDEGVRPVGPGDMIFIPAEEKHRLR